MAGFGGAVKLTGESDYRKALKSITQDLKEVDSELKVVASQYDKNDKSQEALTAQSEALSKKLEAQAKKVGILKDNYSAMSAQAEANRQKHAALKTELENAVSELEKIEKESGKTSAEYKLQAGYVAGLTQDYEKSSKAIDDQEQALSKARIEINKAQVEYNNTDKTLNSFTDSEKDSAKASKDFGNEVEDAGSKAEKSANGGFTVLKGALANLASDAFKAGIKAIKDGLKEISEAAVSAVTDVIDLGDTIADNSKKLGISAEAYQELGYVFEQNGADIESMKSSFLKLTKAIENNDEAFQELGISSEALETMSREEVFKAVLKGLQGIQDENQKTVLANQLLGKGAMELGAVLSDTTDIDALIARVHELGGVMSNETVDAADAMGDSITDMKTALNGVKISLVSQFLPSLNTVVNGLTKIFSGGDIKEGFNEISTGISETADTILNKVIPNVISMIPSLLQNGLPVIISGIETVITSLGAQLPSIIEQLFGALSQVLTDLATWLSQEGNVSNLLSGILALVVDLTNKFAELLPILLPAVFQVIAELADFLTKPENIEMLVTSTIFVIEKIIEALIASLPNILHIFENLGYNLVSGIVKLGTTLGEKAYELTSNIKEVVSTWISNLKSKLTTARDNLFNKAKDFGTNLKNKVKTLVTNVLNFFKDLPSKIVSVGKDTLTGLWNGLQDRVQWIKDRIASLGQTVINSIKSALGVASPSKLTKSVGRYLAEGLGIGFTEEMRDVNEDINDALPNFNDLTTSNSAGALSSTGGLDYYTMVNAFKEALESVNVELDDQKVGKFVKKTVTNAIYQ